MYLFTIIAFPSNSSRRDELEFSQIWVHIHVRGRFTGLHSLMLKPAKLSVRYFSWRNRDDVTAHASGEGNVHRHVPGMVVNPMVTRAISVNVSLLLGTTLALNGRTTKTNINFPSCDLPRVPVSCLWSVACCLCRSLPIPVAQEDKHCYLLPFTLLGDKSFEVSTKTAWGYIFKRLILTGERCGRWFMSFSFFNCVAQLLSKHDRSYDLKVNCYLEI